MRFGNGQSGAIGDSIGAGLIDGHTTFATFAAAAFASLTPFTCFASGGRL
jgi:hypothetical protein